MINTLAIRHCIGTEADKGSEYTALEAEKELNRLHAELNEAREILKLDTRYSLATPELAIAYLAKYKEIS